MTLLAPKQKQYLRGLAHKLKPTVWVKEEGAGESTLKAITDALLQHELIKVRLRRPEEKKKSAQALAAATESTLCGLVGHTAILYKIHPEEPKLFVPGN